MCAADDNWPESLPAHLRIKTTANRHKYIRLLRTIRRPHEAKENSSDGES